MDSNTSPALDTALAYHHAWTSGEFERAMAFIAEDITCHAPAGWLEGKDAFRQFMGPFANSLMDAQMIAAFGDEMTAMLMYATNSALVPDAPAAECVSVREGKITHMHIVFDRLPFAEARRAASAS